jgi:TonB-dependent receptor
MNKPLGVRFGLRWEQTDIDSQALAPSYSGINWVGGNEFSAVQDGTDFTELSGDYNYLLPNLDLRLDVTDDIVARASVSKTLTRPNYADIQGGQTIDQLVRIDSGTGNRGNPALMPFESTNYDLSLEYYYGEGSYVSAGYFRKSVDNFIGSASVTEALFNLPHPGQGAYVDEARAALGATATSGDLRTWILANKDGSPGVDAAANLISGVAGDPVAEFNLTVPVNISEATMKGWELNLQHNFGVTGFGFIVNATLVEASVGYDDMGLGQQFVLSGLGDSANFIGFYDKDGIQARLAYNWRDDFLAGTGQANVGAIPPTYVADYGQWDLSVSYDINDNSVVFLDVINLGNETRHVYGRTELQTLFASQEGTRYNLGVRYTF